MSINPPIQLSSSPLEEQPYLSWLPASDTITSEKEQSERDDDTFHAKNHPQT